MSTIIKKMAASVTLLLTTAVTLLAGVYNPDNLPMPDSSYGANYITNPDGILSPSATDSLNRKLLALEKAKGIKSLIIAIESIEGDDPYELAISVGNRYGVGNKQNTGLIIVLATADRSYYILTGEGLEKHLPDALCKRIENRVMVPLLKKGEWDSALLATVDAISGVLNGDSSLQQEEEEEEKELIMVMKTILVIFSGFGFIIIYALWKQQECPHCGQHKLKLVKRRSKIINGGTQELSTSTYICAACNKEVTRKSVHNRINSSGPTIGGGRSGSSGGFSGGSFGSFGGGSFGGGGAGGRF